MAYYETVLERKENISLMADKKLVLVDGSSYLFRAYYALPPLTNSKGLPTGAVYGVINMLRKLLREEKPDYIVVVFDTKSPNFRHKLFEGYKANRAQMADDLSVQIAPLHDIIRAMGLPLLALEGIEADDVIATLAREADKNQIKTLISTGDKDLAQLVNERITLVNTMTGQVLDPKGVLEKFGVGPERIIDYLALIGDSIDNIPGVPKVGPKTAVKWLQEYGSLDEIINNAEQIKGKVGENLRAHLSQLALSKQLVTVKCDVELAQHFDHFKQQPALTDKLKALFQELEFKTWLQELEKEALPVATLTTATQVETSYEIILTSAQLSKWVNQLAQVKQFAFSTYADSSEPQRNQLMGLSFAIDGASAAYIPLGHRYLGAPEQLPTSEVLAALKPLLENPQIGKIGHHLKKDLHLLARNGIVLQHIAEDTMLQSYVINSIATRHDIEALAEFYLHIRVPSYEEIAGKGAKQIALSEIEVTKAGEFAAQQTQTIWRLQETLNAQLLADPALNQVYREIELPLVQVLWQMEKTGICVDAKKLQAQSQQIAKVLQELEEQAYILAGENFNLGSPKQLQTILYEKLQLPILEKTPKGAPSTAENVLQELSRDYELPRLILSHRTLSKIKSTYSDKLPEQVHPLTHRVHTTYHQAVTTTGRLSSTDPNLQNIPIRTEEGRKIRQAFIPAPGKVLLSADYSQIELRIMAHLSQDKSLLTAFTQGEDIHRYTASEILGISLEEVTPMQRRSAKAINFGLIYGMSSFGLAKQLDMDRTQAQQYMDRYFERYPAVKQYMENTREQAASCGYVETIFGRRLYIPNIRSKNVPARKAAERAAINAPMQGTAADIIKRAMVLLHEKLQGQDEITMLLQVHDELVFEITPQALEQARLLIKETMQNAAILSVPLEVDVGTGPNWDEAH